MKRTNDQTLHLILPYHLDTQSLLHPVIVLECAPSGRHDAQLVALGAILLLVLGLLSAYELDARVDLVRLELVEIEAAADGGRVGFVGEEDQFGERSANLDCGGHQQA
jgi:hypothetical protein